jgi:predicted permease
MNVLNTLAPVFLIVALGALLKRARFISSQEVTGLNRLVYWVGLPCLLFFEITTASYDFHAAGSTFLVVLAGLVVSLAVSYFVARLLNISPSAVGTFVQGSFRSNLMYIGLPIILYGSYNEPAYPAVKNIALLVLAFTIPVYNIVAVVVLLASQHRIDRRLPAKIFAQLVTNPVVIATVAAFLFSAIFEGLPLSISRTFEAVGQIALPLALLGIGGTLAKGSIARKRLLALAASLIKVFIAPAFGFLFALLFFLNPDQTRIALLFLACPAATISYIFAEQLEGDASLAAEIVLISTILSIASLAAVLAICG